MSHPSLISTNFEICWDEEWQHYVLEFPGHIERDSDGDPRLTLTELLELRILIDQLITTSFQIIMPNHHH